MLLPYASYLRVYEPVEQLPAVGANAAGSEATTELVSMTLGREQRSVLMGLVATPASARVQDDLAGGYLMRRDDVLYMCPVDLGLRSWLALASFAEQTDQRTRGLFLLQNRMEQVDDESALQRVSGGVPAAHIRVSTWGVPRTWFLLVEESERESYDDAGAASVRFRTPIKVARERLTLAHAALAALIDDEDLIDELEDLTQWLAAFTDAGWIEVDYAGVAGLLGVELATDRSADEINTALAAMERRDFAAAGEQYRRFVERWRAVNALERAN